MARALADILAELETLSPQGTQNQEQDKRPEQEQPRKLEDILAEAEQLARQRDAAPVTPVVKQAQPPAQAVPSQPKPPAVQASPALPGGWELDTTATPPAKPVQPLQNLPQLTQTEIPATTATARQMVSEDVARRFRQEPSVLGKADIALRTRSPQDREALLATLTPEVRQAVEAEIPRAQSTSLTLGGAVGTTAALMDVVAKPQAPKPGTVQGASMERGRNLASARNISNAALLEWGRDPTNAAAKTAALGNQPLTPVQRIDLQEYAQSLYTDERAKTYERDAVAPMLRKIAAELAPAELREATVRRRVDEMVSQGNMTMRALQQGDLGVALPQLIMDAATAGDVASADRLRELKKQYDDAVVADNPKDQAWYTNLYKATLNMAVPLVKSGAMAAVPAVGIGASTYYWARQGSGDVYTSLRDAGVSHDVAMQVAPLAGLVYAGIENAQVGQLLNIGRKKITGTIAQKMLALMKEKGIDYVKEVGEESFQRLTTDVAQTIGEQMDPNTRTDRKWTDEALKYGKGMLEEAKGAAGPMGIITLLGFGAGAGRIAAQAARRARGPAGRAQPAPEAPQGPTPPPPAPPAAPTAATQTPAPEAPAAPAAPVAGPSSAQSAPATPETTTEQPEEPLTPEEARELLATEALPAKETAEAPLDAEEQEAIAAEAPAATREPPPAPDAPTATEATPAEPKADSGAVAVERRTAPTRESNALRARLIRTLADRYREEKRPDANAEAYKVANQMLQQLPPDAQSAMERVVETLENKAFKDQLTGAWNRQWAQEQGFIQMVPDAKSGKMKAEFINTPNGIFMVDIDNFKWGVNEPYSHAVGDEVLATTIDILSDNLRGKADVVRYGGEEIAVLPLPNVAKDDILKALDAARAELHAEQFSPRAEGPIQETLSGVTFSAGYGDTFDQADGELNQAKRSGRARTFVKGAKYGTAELSATRHREADLAAKHISGAGASDAGVRPAGADAGSGAQAPATEPPAGQRVTTFRDRFAPIVRQKPAAPIGEKRRARYLSAVQHVTDWNVTMRTKDIPFTQAFQGMIPAEKRRAIQADRSALNQWLASEPHTSTEKNQVEALRKTLGKLLRKGDIAEVGKEQKYGSQQKAVAKYAATGEPTNADTRRLQDDIEQVIAAATPTEMYNLLKGKHKAPAIAKAIAAIQASKKDGKAAEDIRAQLAKILGVGAGATSKSGVDPVEAFQWAVGTIDQADIDRIENERRAAVSPREQQPGQDAQGERRDRTRRIGTGVPPAGTQDRRGGTERRAEGEGLRPMFQRAPREDDTGSTGRSGALQLPSRLVPSADVENDVRRALVREFDLSGPEADAIRLVAVGDVSPDFVAVDSAMGAFGWRTVGVDTGEIRNPPNGWVMTKRYPNTIFLNKDVDPAVGLMMTVFHEAGHIMDQENHPAFQRFIRAALDEINESGVAHKNAIRHRDNTEVVMDWLGMEMERPGTWRRLYARAPAEVREFMDRVLEILDRVIAAVSPANRGDQWFDDIRRVRAALDDAMIAIMADKRAQTAPAKVERRPGETDAQFQIRAYHGSPYRFKHFDTPDKVGRTGEGNMAFGYGLYFTDSKGIAEHYASQKKQKPKLLEHGLPIYDISPDAQEAIISALEFANDYHGGDIEYAKRLLRGWRDEIKLDIETASFEDRDTSWSEHKLNAVYEALAGIANSMALSLSPPTNTVYTVTVHKGKTPDQYDYLQWDKPVTQAQFEKMAKSAEKTPLGGYSAEWFRNRAKGSPVTGEVLYNVLGSVRDERAASMFLLRGGIDGIEYPAGTLSGYKGKARNYVVFDENSVTIEELNGEPIDQVKFQKRRAPTEQTSLFGADSERARINVDKTVRDLVNANTDAKREELLRALFGGMTEARAEELDEQLFDTGEPDYANADEAFWHETAREHQADVEVAARERNEDELRAIVEKIDRDNWMRLSTGGRTAVGTRAGIPPKLSTVEKYTRLYADNMTTAEARELLRAQRGGGVEYGPVGATQAEREALFDQAAEQARIEIAQGLPASSQNTEYLRRQIEKAVNKEIADNKASSRAERGDTKFQKRATTENPQIYTPEFKKWFGDWENDPENSSKVVDKDGKPMVVYHGTPNTKFSVFDYSRVTGRNEGQGFYFTTDRDVADGYGTNGRTIAAYLSITNPLHYDAPPFGRMAVRKLLSAIVEQEGQDGIPATDGFLSNYGDISHSGMNAVMREATEALSEESDALSQLGGLVGAGVPVRTVNTAVTRALGYDGIVSDGFSGAGKGGGKIFVAFHPTQIKSAIDNTGAFDSENPDIRFQKRTRTFYEEDARLTDRLRRLGERQFAQTEERAGGKEAYEEARANKRTQLGYRQWVQVRTPAFLRWFGDWQKHVGNEGALFSDPNVSKAVNRQTGEPLELFHGTKTAGFTEFRNDESARQSAPGIFLTSRPQTAQTYSGTRDRATLDRPPHPGNYGVFANIRNAHEESFEGANWDGTRNGQFAVFIDRGDDEYPEQVYSEDGRGYFDSKKEAEALAEKHPGATVIDAPDVGYDTNSVVREAKRYRMDGAILRDVQDDGPWGTTGETSDVFVVFDPANIKSSTDNVGTYLGRTEDIRFQRRGAGAGQLDLFGQPAEPQALNMFDTPAAAAAMREPSQPVEHPADIGPKTPVTSTKKLEDFGEKIGGARKDYAKAYGERIRMASDVDISTAPLSQSWPEPDYEKLLKEGADPWSVAYIHAARDEIPAKPKLGRRVARWAEVVNTMRTMAAGVLSGEITKQSIEKASAVGYSDKVMARAELYQELGHERSLKDWELNHAHYRMVRVAGKEENNVWKWEVARRDSGGLMGRAYMQTVALENTREAALQALRERLNAAARERPDGPKLLVYTKPAPGGGGAREAWIGVKIGSNWIDLHKAASAGEAVAYRNAHKQELLDKLERIRQLPSERRAENRERVGTDWRQGKDVTPEQFSEKFGFRGVEFGNWLPGPERQSHLNRTYDSLSDLAAVLSVSPKALSLNGELGIAFGARGTGGKEPAAAHYEPKRVVINLTRHAGAGNLAHEWWHAFDNYLSRRRGKPDDHITDAPMRLTQSADPTRTELLDAMRDMVAAIESTGMRKRARASDKFRTKPYWSTRTEMTARAFESYVLQRLAEQNVTDDYLVNIATNAEYTTALWKTLVAGDNVDEMFPYPLEDEMPAIRAGMDKLWDTIQVRTEGDRDVLFQKRSDVRDGWYSPALRAAEALKQEHGTGAQMVAMLKKTPGVKQAELDWLGVDAKFASKSTVSKQEIVDHVRNNQIAIEETHKSNADFYVEAEKQLRDVNYGDGNWWYEVLKEEKERIYNEVSTTSEVVSYDEDENASSWKLTWNGTERIVDEDPDDMGAQEVIDMFEISDQEILDRYEGLESNIADALPDLVREMVATANAEERLTSRFGGGSNATKFDDWQLPNGKNYREVLLQLPVGTERPAKPFVNATHWSEQNVFAHTRVNDRTSVRNGTGEEKVLFVEEIQSDWAKEAREHGVVGPVKEDITELPEGYSVVQFSPAETEMNKAFGLFDNNVGAFFVVKGPDGESVGRPDRVEAEAVKNALRSLNAIKNDQSHRVPNQPFLKNWHEVILRRLIQMATEQGYSRIAFISGQQTADRYNLAKQVDAISYSKDENGSYRLRYKRGADGWKTIPAEGKPLEDVVGKSLAEKIKNGDGEKIEAGAWTQLEGDDLKVGGEWAKTLYDKVVPQFLDKFGKPFGVGVERVAVSDVGDSVVSLPITDAMKAAVADEGMPMFQKRHPKLERTSAVTENPEQYVQNRAAIPPKVLSPWEVASVKRIIQMQKEAARLRAELNRIPQDRLIERAAIALDLKEYEQNRHEIIVNAIYDYAKKIGLQGIPYNHVDGLLKRSKTAKDLERAVSIMDRRWQEALNNALRKKVIQTIAREKLRLARLQGRAKSMTSLYHNRMLAEYLQRLSVESSDKQGEIQRTLTWFLENPREEMPEYLNKRIGELFAENINAMTNEQLQRTLEDIQSIKHEGRTKYRLGAKREQEEMDAAAERLQTEIKQTGARHPYDELVEQKRTKAGKLAKRAVDEAKRFVWAHARPERIIRWFSGWKTGELYDKLWKPLHEAEMSKRRHLKQAMTEFQERHKDIDIIAAKTKPIGKTILKDGTGESTVWEYTLANAMAVYAHSQNPGNLAHLHGTGMTDDIIADIVSHIPQEAKDAVDAQIDYYDNKQYARMSVAFEQEHSVPMPKEHRYFPIQNLATDRAETSLVADMLARASARKAGLQKGMTKSRVNSDAPFRQLDYFDTVVNNVIQSEQYIAMVEPVRKVMKVLNHPKVRGAMEAKSKAAYEQLVDWVKAVAYGRVRGSENALDRASDWFRGNFQVAALGFNALTPIKQISSLPRGLAGIPEKYVRDATGRLLSGKGWDFIRRSSTEMETRPENYERELAEMAERMATQRTEGVQGKIDTAKEWSMKGIQWVDYGVASTVWYAKYLEVFDKTHSHSKAVEAADAQVRNTQSQGDILNLPQIYRGSGLARAYTMFTNDLNQGANMLWEMAGTAKDKGAWKTADQFFWAFMVPAFILYEVSNAFAPPQDDPEGLGETLLDQVAGGFMFAGQLIRAAARGAANASRKARGAPQDTKTTDYLVDLTPTSLQWMVDLGEGLAKAKPEKLWDALATGIGVPGYLQGKKIVKGFKAQADESGAWDKTKSFIWGKMARRDRSVQGHMAKRLHNDGDWRDRLEVAKYLRELEGSAAVEFKQKYESEYGPGSYAKARVRLREAVSPEEQAKRFNQKRDRIVKEYRGEERKKRLVELNEERAEWRKARESFRK